MNLKRMFLSSYLRKSQRALSLNTICTLQNDHSAKRIANFSDCPEVNSAILAPYSVHQRPNKIYARNDKQVDNIILRSRQ